MAAGYRVQLPLGFLLDWRLIVRHTYGLDQGLAAISLLSIGWFFEKTQCD